MLACYISGAAFGSTNRMVLLHVCPFSLGIETVNGTMSTLIPRNTAIPSKKSDMAFTTVKHQQTFVEILVFKGESSNNSDNNLFGKFELKSIEPAARGVPQIDVTFEIGVNGILQVTAEEKYTGNREKIELRSQRSGSLEPEEVQQMMYVANQIAQADKKIKRKVRARDDLEAYVYSLNKQLTNKERG